MAIKFVEREPEPDSPTPPDPVPDVPAAEPTPLPEVPKPKRRPKSAAPPAIPCSSAGEGEPRDENRPDAAPAEPDTTAAPLLPGIPAGSRKRRRGSMMGFG